MNIIDAFKEAYRLDTVFISPNGTPHSPRTSWETIRMDHITSDDWKVEDNVVVSRDKLREYIAKNRWEQNEVDIAIKEAEASLGVKL